MGKLRVKSVWLWLAIGAALATQYYSAKLVWAVMIFLAVYAGENEDALHEHYQDKLLDLENDLTSKHQAELIRIVDAYEP